MESFDSLPNELKLIIADDLDNLSYYSLQLALSKKTIPFPRRLIPELLQADRKILKYYLESKILLPEIFYCEAIRLNDLKVLQWAKENGFLRSIQLLIQESARRGHLDILKWLYQEFRPFCSIPSCRAAIQGGQLDTLSWLLKKQTNSMLFVKSTLVDFEWEELPKHKRRKRENQLTESITLIESLRKYALNCGQLFLARWLQEKAKF
jgi:hypothetical protein